MSTWLFSLDDGAAPLVITQHVEIPSIARDRRIHTELKANVNTCAFRCRFDAALWGYLISAPSIQISITKDSAAYFYGCVSPNFETKIRDGQKYIEIRAEDYSLKKLGQTITTPLICPGYAVCNPAAPSASLVHVIAAAAGVTVSPAVPTIADVVPYVIALPGDKPTYAAVLGSLLFEYKHVFNFAETGLLDVVPFVNAGTISPAGTLSTAPGIRNIRGELAPKKIAEKYDDIRISYSEIEHKTGLVLFQDTEGATDKLACSIELAATGDSGGKDYYPKTAKDGEVFANWNSPDGYDIWIATSAAMDVALGSGIVVQRAFSNYYRRGSFGYRNTAAAARSITKMRITGNAYVRTSKNTARVATSGAADLLEHECQYLFNKAGAQALAQALAQYYRYADMTYAAKSIAAFALGAYVTVADPVYSGISTLCRVVGISEEEKQPGLYTYTLEGAASFETVAIVMEGSATPPSAPNIGGQTPQEIATAIALASKTLTISASAITRSRAGDLAPASITAGGRNADGTLYYGRFRISLSHDGQTYQDVYSSIADEASKSYPVPATMTVGAETHYVTSVRVQLYAAGGFDTLLGTGLCSVSLDVSAAPVYFGSKTAAPTGTILTNDFYFDNQASAAGGGVIRYWTGSAWVVGTTSWPGYFGAVKLAIDDIAAWVNSTGNPVPEVTAFMSAIINNAIIKNGIIDFLATSIQVSTAMCLDGVTRIAEMDWDNGKMTLRNPDQSLKATLDEAALTTEEVIDETRTQFTRIEGKALKIGDINPSTLAETVVASIERDDFSDEQAVIRGKLTVPLFTGSSQVKVRLAMDTNRSISILYNSKIYLPSNGSNILEIYDVATDTAVTKTLPNSMARQTAQLHNGKIYMPQTAGTILEIYDIASGSTITKTLSQNMYRMTSLLYDGKIYMPQGGGTTLEIYDIASDSTIRKTLPTNMSRRTSQLYNGKIYMPQGTGGATLEIYDIASGTTVVKTLPTNMQRSTSQLCNGKIYMPGNGGTTLEIYNIETGSTATKTLPNNMNRATSILYSDMIYMPRSEGAIIEIYDTIKDTVVSKSFGISFDMFTCTLRNAIIYLPQNFGSGLGIYEIETRAQVGAGIIESGFVSGRGWYVKYGDGTMEQRKRQAWALVATSQPTTRMEAWMLPMPFIDTDFVIVATATDPGGGSWGDVGAIARNGLLAMNAAVNQANLGFYPYQQATSQTVRYDGYVKGRWKA